jgi:hypothetical protein
VFFGVMWVSNALVGAGILSAVKQHWQFARLQCCDASSRGPCNQILLIIRMLLPNSSAFLFCGAQVPLLLTVHVLVGFKAFQPLVPKTSHPPPPADFFEVPPHFNRRLLQVREHLMQCSAACMHGATGLHSSACNTVVGVCHLLLVVWWAWDVA